MDGSLVLAPVPQASAQPHVFMVAQENVLPLWPGVAELFAPLIDPRPTHDIGDVLASILAQRSQLWVQWHNGLEGAFVTEFASYPKGTWVRVWLLAVHPDKRMSDDIFKQVDRWRHATDCRGIEVIGRLGWLRRFPDAENEGAVIRLTME